MKQTSEIIGISIHTIRFYDKEGLLPNLMKRNQRRCFDVGDLERLYMIQCLRDTGMGIPEVRRYITACLQGDITLGERFQLIRQQTIKVEKEISLLKWRLTILKKKSKYYEDRISGIPTKPWKPDIKRLIKKADVAKRAASNN